MAEAEARAAYDAVLSHWVTQGPRVEQFERDFARYVGSADAVAVSSCTTGLHLAMVLSGISRGDEVICPSMSYIATANSIVHAGATPVFAEVGEDYNLDLCDAERRITPRTRAILLVHQLGLPADIDRFSELCDRRGLLLIEDAACAAGSSYRGNPIGVHSDLVTFSFHPRKVITTGDGGMITTSREDYARRARLLRHHGMTASDRLRHESTTLIFEDHGEVGYNYRMTDIQAAVGIEQLKRLDWLVGERTRIARRYDDALADFPYLRRPSMPEHLSTNHQSYCVYLAEGSPVERDELMQALWQRGISTRRGVMTTHRTTAYAHLALSLPISERLEDRSVILPLFVPMTESEIGHVLGALRDVLKAA